MADMSLGSAGYHIYLSAEARKAERTSEHLKDAAKKCPSAKHLSSITSISDKAKQAIRKLRNHLFQRSHLQFPQDEDCKNLLTHTQPQSRSRPTKILPFSQERISQEHINGPFDIFEPLPAAGPRFEGYVPLPSTPETDGGRSGFDLAAMSREEVVEWVLSGGIEFAGSDAVPLLGRDGRDLER